MREWCLNINSVVFFWADTQTFKHSHSHLWGIYPHHYQVYTGCLVYTTESWCEFSQTQRVEISWLRQLQDFQMLLKDLLSFLPENKTN